MNAVLKLLRKFAEQFFKVSITIPSYRSSAVFSISLMCGRIPLKILKISHFSYFITLSNVI